MVTDLAPKRPRSLSRWQLHGRRRLPDIGGFAMVWRCDGIQVLSAVESPEGFPEFHVSVTVATGLAYPERRCATDQEIEFVRSQFAMGGAEEDNHGAGIARHLWLRVDADRQDPCPCKQDEERTVEGDRVRHDEVTP